MKGLYKYEKHEPSDAFKELLGEVIEVAQEIGRREGFLPEDRRLIANLIKATSFKELKSMTKKIKDKKLKRFFDKHIIKYIKLARKKIRNFPSLN